MTTMARSRPSLPPQKLKQFERIVLAAVQTLDDAYGYTIWQDVRRTCGKPVSLGSTYAALDGMLDRGYLQAWMEDGPPERNGYRKRCYRLKPDGVKALKHFEKNASPALETAADTGRIV
jgi:DNA-binding PadR family transcriptional regulator